MPSLLPTSRFLHPVSWVRVGVYSAWAPTPIRLKRAPLRVAAKLLYEQPIDEPQLWHK